jgi:hypothetical protein
MDDYNKAKEARREARESAAKEKQVWLEKKHQREQKIQEARKNAMENKQQIISRLRDRTSLHPPQHFLPIEPAQPPPRNTTKRKRESEEEDLWAELLISLANEVPTEHVPGFSDEKVVDLVRLGRGNPLRIGPYLLDTKPIRGIPNRREGEEKGFFLSFFFFPSGPGQSLGDSR